MIRVFGIRLQVLLLVAGPLVFLIVVAAIAGTVLQRTDAATQLSRHSASILSESDSIYSTVNRGNASLVDYARSHNEASLDAYHKAVADIHTEVRDLRTLVGNDPVTQPAADNFENVVLQVPGVWAAFEADVRAHDMKKAQALAAAPATRKLSAEWQNAKMGFDANLRQHIIARLDGLRKSLHNLEMALVVVSIIGILFTFLIALQFGWSIVSRLRRLAQNAEHLSIGQPTQPIGGNDEIAKLDVAYHEVTRRMMRSLEERERAVEAYEREHTVAITLQRALLPASLPKIPGLRIDGAYVPAAEGAEVGGDWYDVFELPNHCVGLSVGDVAGHGLRAAVSMGTMRQLIRSVARFESSPAAVLSAANRALCAEDPGLVTAFFGILDRESGTLRYSLAGHPAPLVLRPSGDATPLEGDGIVLGFDRNTVYRDFETTLKIGAGLVLFTDGVVEIERDFIKGISELEEAAIAEYFDPSSNIAEGIQRRVMRSLKARDDAAVLFVGITALKSASGPSARQWTFDAFDQAAVHRMKRAVLRQFAGLESTSVEFGAIEAILGELLSNVARHSPGEATVTLESRDGELILHVTDSGDPFELTESPPDPLAESGRGLMIVRAFSRKVVLARFDGGNRVSAVLPLPKSSSSASA